MLRALPAQADSPRHAFDNPALRPADYQPSGDYYDWRKAGQPERPWFHKYDQSLVMKIFLAERTDEGRGCRVYLTFEPALEVIERLDRIACGAPKIVYLVGWQYNGHDSKHPAWGEVNPFTLTRRSRLSLSMRDSRASARSWATGRSRSAPRSEEPSATSAITGWM